MTNALYGKPANARQPRTLIVSRHPGAVDWLRQRAVRGILVRHLDLSRIEPGDVVVGTLPIQQIEAVGQRGARYLHLCVNVPEHLRGREFTAAELDRLGAHLKGYVAFHRP